MMLAAMDQMAATIGVVPTPSMSTSSRMIGTKSFTPFRTEVPRSGIISGGRPLRSCLTASRSTILNRQT